MNLNRSIDDQIQALIADAPQDGTTPQLVQAVAPILSTLAGQLRHLQYYLVQTLERDWAMVTVEGGSDGTETKNVVYAFPTLKDTADGPFPTNDPQLISLPMPVTHILFQMVALEGVDSVVFFETPGNLNVGTEIQRQEVMTLIQGLLQPPSSGGEVPSDWA
jgi:hypothetical protein